MRVVLLGGGMRSSVLGLALSLHAFESALIVPPRGSAKRSLAEVIAIDECERFMAQQMDESQHPGERHREAVKRVNSGRSRAGKAARWA